LRKAIKPGLQWVFWVPRGGLGKVELFEGSGAERGRSEVGCEEDESWFWGEEEEVVWGMGRLVIISREKRREERRGQFVRAKVRDTKKRKKEGR
jgi:hypothetical protein